MQSIIEQVMHFRNSKYTEDLREKMLNEGIAAPADLFQVSVTTADRIAIDVVVVSISKRPFKPVGVLRFNGVLLMWSPSSKLVTVES